MARAPRRYVRQMPKIYGSLQKPRRDWSFFFRTVKQVSLGIGAILLLYAVFFGPFFRVRKVDIQGVILSNPDELSKSVPLGGSIWFLPKDTILKGIAQDPLVTNVSILRGIPDTLRLVITERQPAFVWVSNGMSILVDSQGIAFTQYTQDTLPDVASSAGAKIASLPHVVDTKNINVTLGKPLVGRTFISFIEVLQTDFLTDLPGVHVTSAQVGNSTYDLTVFTKEGMQVQFNTLGDAGVQVRNLTRLVHQNKVNTASSHVDLRIDRWAYVS